MALHKSSLCLRAEVCFCQVSATLHKHPGRAKGRKHPFLSAQNGRSGWAEQISHLSLETCLVFAQLLIGFLSGIDYKTTTILLDGRRVKLELW